MSWRQQTEMAVVIPASLKAVIDAEVARTKATASSVVTAALSNYLGVQVHTLFQISISGALVAGVYDREVSVRSILAHGDFGLGTFANLDGEMVVLEGQVYQVQGTGRVSEASPDAGAPFAVVTQFSPQIDLEIETVTSFKDLHAEHRREQPRQKSAAGQEPVEPVKLVDALLAIRT